MALEYTLAISTKLLPEELVALIERIHKVKRMDDFLVGPGLSISVYIQGRLGRKIINDALGINSTVCILFRLDKINNTDAGRELMLLITAFLLKVNDGDFVLLFNGEDVLMVRIRGKLTLNKSIGFWKDPSFLAYVTSPYEMNEIPSL